VSKIAELAELLHDAKSGPCVDCGRQYPIHVMQLDHRPGTHKRFHVSDPLWGKPSPGLDAAAAELGSVVAAMRAEIDKCDLVCANCHAERTFRRGLAKRARVQPSWCRHYRDDRLTRD